MKNRFIKKHYLISILLWIPPIHELGHVIIDSLIGQKIIEINWFNYVRVTAFNDLNWINNLWEFSVFIPFVLLLLCIWINYKYSLKKHILSLPQGGISN
jgi:hypothetical protein